MAARLDRTASVTLTGGDGTLAFGPERYRERWRVSRISTEGNSGAQPTLHIYRGAAGGDLLDYTKRGNSAISENNPPVELQAGETMTCVYSVGTDGAVMQLHIEGEIDYAISG